MSSHDDLVENYEDALFFMLMDRIVAMEGKAFRLEDCELSEENSELIPPEAHLKCIETINRAFECKKQKSYYTKPSKLFKYVLIAAIVVSFMLTTVYAVVPEIKYAIVNAVYNITSRDTDILFENSMKEGGDDRKKYASSFSNYILPEMLSDFDMEEEGEDVYSVWRVYSKGSSSIRIEIISNGENLIHSIDTEDAVVQKIIISNYEALVTEEGEFVRVVLVDEENQTIINIRANNIGKEVLIRLASEIEYEG